MRKVKFFTLGCKVNQYETQGLREQLLGAGFEENGGEVADVYIINTCTVTARADTESCRLVRRALRSNPKSKIIVTGCYIEKDAANILSISSKIQIVPNRQKHRIVNLLNLTHDASLGFARDRQRIPRLRSGQATHNETFIPLKISSFNGHERAFVKIQDGCNNFCSYCKVPFVRGNSRSRSLEEIIEEVTRLVNGGFKEIVLTGICLGDYHYGDSDLVDILSRLEKIEGRFRIRLSSIEPQLVNDKLIESFNSPKICPHLHIPLQSGDNAILKRMNRRYTQKGYLSLIARIKKKVKDIAITTDILVGFPGEEEKNFRNTLRCLKEILPLCTHIFPFSPRQGTAAFNLQERVKPGLIKERVNLLREVAVECSYEFRRHFLGKRLTLLIESQTDKENGTLSGYSQNYIRVSVEDAIKEDVNNLIRARVKVVDMYSTKAQCLGRGVARHRGLQSAQQKKARTI